MAPEPRAVRRHRNRALTVALGALLIGGACSPGARQAPAVRLLDRAAADASLRWESRVVSQRVFDFTAMSRLEGVEVKRADWRLGREGLVLQPFGPNPALVFDALDFPFNLIRIEMIATRSGQLLAFWASGRSAFGRGQRAMVWTAASDAPATYDIDLWGELEPGQRYRVRIRPTDQRAEVRVQRVAFVEAAYTLPEAQVPREGRVAVSGEVRQAIALAAGESVEKLLPAAGGRLVFGLARGRGGDGAVTLRVWQRRTAEPLLEVERRLEAGQGQGWAEHSVELASCPDQRCRVGFEAISEGAGDPPSVVLVGNPTVIAGGEGLPPNVVLVSLDTLGARHLSCLGGPAGLTPRLDALAATGVVFANAFASSSATHTAHASLLTGRAPLATSYYWLDGRPGDEPTLAQILRDHGYLTAAFTGGVLMSPRYGLDRGFDTFYQHESLYRPLAEHSDVGPITARALSWVDHHAGAPFFLLLHSYEVHGPYVYRGPAAGDAVRPESLLRPGDAFDAPHMRGRLPVSLAELPGLVEVLTTTGEAAARAGVERDGVEPLRQAYQSEVRFLDQAVGAFLDALDARGQLADAIVVVTADHGEAFFEHGLLQHGLLYDENLRVPLIVRASGRLPGGRRVSQAVSAMDVAPTILELAGVPVPPGTQGRPLAPLALGRETADRDCYALVLGDGLSWLVAGRHKLIVRAALAQENFGSNQLFDLVEDPGEERDLLAEGVTVPPRLDELMRRTIEELPGVHVDLGALAGRELCLTLPYGSGSRDDVYAFDVTRLSPGLEDAPEVLRPVLAFSERSRLVLRNRQRGRTFTLSFRSPAGSEPLVFVIEPPSGPQRRIEVRAVDGQSGVALAVWRVGETTGSATVVDPQEEARLRALGYLQ